jgi:hypothetical protein
VLLSDPYVLGMNPWSNNKSTISLASSNCLVKYGDCQDSLFTRHPFCFKQSATQTIRSKQEKNTSRFLWRLISALDAQSDLAVHRPLSRDCAVISLLIGSDSRPVLQSCGHERFWECHIADCIAK